MKIYHEKYAFFQPDYSGMTPNGNIYIHGEVIDDYGKATISPDSKAFFIHEMVHVWQKHNGVLNPIVSAILYEFVLERFIANPSSASKE